MTSSAPVIRVHGFSPEVRALFCSTQPPQVKLTEANRVLHPPKGLVAAMGSLPHTGDHLARAADRAARLGSYEVCAMQQAWGCFNPTRNVDLTVWCYEQFDRHDVEARVHDALAQTAAEVGFRDPLVAVVVPADPANLNLMVACGGLSVASTRAGQLALQIWPDRGNLARLESVLSRSLRLAQRWRAAPPRCLRDLLRAEGAVTRELVASDGVPTDWRDAPWTLAYAPPRGHTDTLRQIATACGEERYDQLETNVYGNQGVATEHGVDVEAQLDSVTAARLDAEALDREAAWLEETGLPDSDDPRDAAAVLYGDRLVERVGHPAHGFSAWAGLQIAAERPDRG